MNRVTWPGVASGVSLLLLVLVAPASARGEDCVESGYQGSVHTVTPGAAPDLRREAWGSAAAAVIDVRDTTAEDPDAPGYRFSRHLRFDLPSGEFGFGFAPGAYFQCSANAVVDERFVVSGLPLDSPVELRLRLDIEVCVDRIGCGSDCELSVYSRMDSPAGSVEQWRDFTGPAGPTSLVWSQDVFVPVQSGREFALRFALASNSPDAANSVEVAARWSFPDLAPGIDVRSCLGGNGPTPVNTASWGMLKARYR